ncbi:MAG: tRNA(Ile)-lysidine synthetase, partial [Oscillospiraceae bacterium]|nr:tRNA(Ile)-lysidine synthetase [Oscillospiraceae bacterium]
MSNSEALVNDILNFADELDMLPKSGSLIVCVSGGADSMCLLYVMLEISKKRGFAVLAAHFNHGLREEESDRDETFVRKHCADIGVPLYSGSGDTRAFALKQGMGIEEAA